MTKNKLPYTHLLYVRKYSIFSNDYELYIIGVNTKDIFHTMGEYIYRSIEHIKRITQVECTQARLDYLIKEKRYKIYEFRDKYPILEERK